MATSYVCGFPISWDLKTFLLAMETKEGALNKDMWNGVGGKIKKYTMIMATNNSDRVDRDESPHEAMARELGEEANIISPGNLWMFHYKKYISGDICYFFIIPMELRGNYWKENSFKDSPKIRMFDQMDLMWDVDEKTGKSFNFASDVKILMDLALHSVRKGSYRVQTYNGYRYDGRMVD